MNFPMIKWAKDLFPICRSLTGDGTKKTLNYFLRLNPEFKFIKFKSGKKVFDWVIPLEWNIKDAYIIDIAVDFAILTKVGFNKNDVLLRCVAAVKDFFNIDNWQIGQPIVTADIVYELSLVEGVAAVTKPLESTNDSQIVTLA